MSGAKKCNRCATLFVPVVGDLIINGLDRYVKPNPTSKDDIARGTLWQQSIYSEDDQCDLCSNCTASLRNFLKSITGVPPEGLSRG